MEEWRISMVRAIASVFGMSALIALAIMTRPAKHYVYEAKCVYAYWKSDAPTNAAGEVVQPVMESRIGAYTDYCRVAEEDLICFLSSHERRPSLFREYLSSHTNAADNIEAVSNAFAKVHHAVSGNPIAVVALSTEAESQELALDVVNFTIARYLAHARENESFREEKALAAIKAQIRERRQGGGDEADLADTLEKARHAVRRYRDKVTIVKHPFVRRVER